MTLLNDADKIYRGTQVVDKVYVGDVKAWPPVPLVMAGTPVITGDEFEDNDFLTPGTGSNYAGFTVTASGGTPPYHYGLAAGRWPAGITMDAATGVVSGMPDFESAGTYSNIVIRAMDSLGAIGKLAPFTLTIDYKDPYYADVNLLLDYDAPEGSTEFTDQKFGITGSNAGQAHHSRTKPPSYGLSAIALDGSGDYIAWPPDPKWYLTDKSFSIDFTMCPTSLTLAGQVTFMLASFGANPPALSWVFYFNSNGSVSFNCSTDGSNNIIVLTTAAGTLFANVWSRWRLTYDGTTYRIYKDGDMLVDAVATHTKQSVPQLLTIGCNSSTNGWFFSGYCRGIRLTVGSCRSPGPSYTVSNRPFPSIGVIPTGDP